MPSSIAPEDIRLLRSRLGWSMREMGTFLGVSAASVSDWENGRVRPDAYRAATLEQLRLRLDQVEEQERREEFMNNLAAVATGAGVGMLLGFLFSKQGEPDEDSRDEDSRRAVREGDTET